MTLRNPVRPTSRELGRAARVSIPPTSLADLVVSSLRPDPVGLVEQQNATRLPGLLPLRAEQLAASPFGFFQGAAVVMADDLAGTPTSGLMVQLCGDANVANFGVYRTSGQRLVFDILDFDETHAGPWEWDVRRLASSLAVAGRQGGFTTAQRRTILLRAARAYRKAMLRFSRMSNLEMWFSQADADEVRRLQKFGTALHIRTSVARRRPQVPGNGRGPAALTEMRDGARRFVHDPPRLVPVADLLPDDAREDVVEHVRHLLEDYQATLSGDSQFLLEHFRVAEVARCVGSPASTGKECWLVLLTGKDTDEPLLLQVKEAQRSVLYPLAHVPTSAEHGARVVAGQKLIQAAGDIFLGWHRVAEPGKGHRDYYVREMRDWLPTPEVTHMAPYTMGVFGELCGWALARAHARSGDRTALAAYLGDDDQFDMSLADYAESYADLNEQDYARFLAARRSSALLGGG